MVNTKIHDNEFAKEFFPNGIPYDIVNGLERCAYCGSINPDVLLDSEKKIEYIATSDDGQKEYYNIDGHQVKLYREHMAAYE